MAHFAICDALGGCIGAGVCADAALERQQPTDPAGSIVEIDAALYDAINADILGYRLEAGAIVPRDMITASVSADTIAADGAAEAAITGLPDPCTVTIRGAVSWGPGKVTGGSLTLTSTTPGRIIVRASSDPLYRPWSTQIDAT